MKGVRAEKYRHSDTDIELPKDLIFFVTSRCNLRCGHCFYWQNLGRRADLSLAEIARLAKSLPGLRTLSLSGGEPFLRRDLPEVCETFIVHCKLACLEIPTNGSMPEQIADTVEQIAGLSDRIELSISISLDGPADVHDANRGLAGAFDRAVDCAGRLLELKGRYPRLKVNVLTTVSRGRCEELTGLADFVARELPAVDNLYWGLLRGDLMEGGPAVPTVEEVAYLDEFFLNWHAQRKTHDRLVFLSKLYDLRRGALKDKRQPIPCVAGSSIGVIYDNGDVAPCEMLPPMGNIRGQSFERIWQGEPAKRARARIESGKCACTHECFLYPSYLADLNQRPLHVWRVGGFRPFVGVSRDRLRAAGSFGVGVDRMIGSFIYFYRMVRQSVRRR